MQGGTCRCYMCGKKNADCKRNEYWRYGIRCDEDGPNHQRESRRQMRHRLRQALKNETRKELV